MGPITYSDQTIPGLTTKAGLGCQGMDWKWNMRITNNWPYSYPTQQYDIFSICIAFKSKVSSQISRTNPTVVMLGTEPPQCPMYSNLMSSHFNGCPPDVDMICASSAKVGHASIFCRNRLWNFKKEEALIATLTKIVQLTQFEKLIASSPVLTSMLPKLLIIYQFNQSILMMIGTLLAIIDGHGRRACGRCIDLHSKNVFSMIC